MIVEIPFATPAYDEAIRLRHDILRQPLGLEFKAEDLAKEYDQIHFGYYENGSLVGCMTLHPYGEGIAKMRQVAVAETHQKRGIGKQLTAHFEAYAKRHGYTEIVLHARAVAAVFYEQLGYKVIGEPFEEVNIPHFKMWKAVR